VANKDGGAENQILLKSGRISQNKNEKAIKKILEHAKGSLDRRTKDSKQQKSCVL
jgi:hypothetical protein